MNLDESGKASNVALPPYFPIDRNEAFISASDPDLPPASPLSKTIGLAWEVHRAEVLPLLAKILPKLATPELQQAADDVIKNISDPAGAVVLADLSLSLQDPIRQRQILSALGRKLDGPWREARTRPEVVKAIQSALNSAELRTQGIETAAASGDPRYVESLLGVLTDQKAADEARAAAVDAIGRIKPPQAAKVLDDLIDQSRERKSSDPAAEAAVRALPRLGDARDRLTALLQSEDVPLGLRREALRSLTTQGDGARRVLNLAKEGKLPDTLKTEAATVLRTHPDRGIRDATAEALPIRTASGKPLPSVYELIRRDGQADKGREVFFRSGTNACGGCHRVQGQGQWVGPDLSTIGTKYGKDELLRSILSPSAAIGYNFRSVVVATTEGQAITGLPVEETPDRLVLKTAEGKRVSVRPSEIEGRQVSEISLMPEGLAESLTEQDLVDLLAFLATLKQPVSIVGRFDAVSLEEPGDRPTIDPKAKFDGSAPVKGADGASRTWRRLEADAEGRIDLAALAGGQGAPTVYLHAPVASPEAQPARLVIDTTADVRVWLGGEEVRLSSGEGGPRSAEVKLPKGPTDLLIRATKAANAAVVATLVADRPLEFSPAEAAKAAAR